MVTEAIRAFIAIELPAELQDKLAAVIDEIQKSAGRSVRWVTPRNIHLTLKFLGNVSPANLDSLTNVIKHEAIRYPSFSIGVGGLGAFPNKIRPRVIWVAVSAPGALAELQRGIDRETNRLGYPGEDHAFSPHLTLGRVAQHASPQSVKMVADSLAALNVGELGCAEVQTVQLFRSDLQPAGAIYTPLLKAPLAAG